MTFNKRHAGIFVLAYFLFAASSTYAVSPVNYVDPFICTSGDHGQLYPGAVVPFGMVKLSPDTYPGSLTGNGNWAHSGYNYADTKIRGFSHLRIGGAGGTKIYDRSWFFSLLPLSEIPEDKPQDWLAAIDKKFEHASPGQYHTYLNEQDIHVSLTVDKHSGFHRYIFPKSENSGILFSAGSLFRVKESSVEIVDDDEFRGYAYCMDRFSRGKLFFYAEVSQPFYSFSTWEDEIYQNKTKLNGARVGAILYFRTEQNDTIYVKIGFSTVSREQARKNMLSEIPDWDFERTVQKAVRAWEEVLSSVIVEGNEEYKKIFYTALYHSCLMPVTTTDIDGKYRGADDKIHTARGYTHYDSFAFWDTFRTKYPLLSLTQPAILKEIVQSIMDIYDEGRWKIRGGFYPFLTVRYEHILAIMVDAYMKGLFDGDPESAYLKIRQDALRQLPEKYEKIGYLPKRPDRTLEYSYDDWCVANMAQALDKEDDYEKFSCRADFYKNVWDNDIKFFRAKGEDGDWLEFPDDPTHIDETYVYEGSMWQWRWFVLHDVPGLIELMGGNEKFAQQLDYFFSNDLYNHGNQPDLHSAFLFNYAGAPWLTQKWVRKILTEPMTQLYGTHEFFDEPIHDRIYKATPDGYLLEMDDDCGCMAGWYAMSAMGLYQVCPGDPVYQLTAPIFDKVTLKLDSAVYPGSKFTIRAEGLSEKNIYIQSATLNGHPFDKSWISHTQIVQGGELVYQMGNEPKK